MPNIPIIVDIVGAMLDYCSIQPDIDETKVKAANIIAQDIDISIIGQTAIERCITPSSAADEELLKLVAPALCYFTYARLLKMFPGTFTDAGYIIDKEASDKNVTRTAANEYSSIGEDYLKRAIIFLNQESPTAVFKDPNQNPRIRVFGGRESR